MDIADAGTLRDDRFSGPRHCPRCGYDQRGILDTWKPDEPWPLDGTCSECGLLFAWLDVFRPERKRLTRFVEHSTGFWSTGLAAVWTALWAIWPAVFWKRVTLETKVVPRRWLIWLAWLVGVPAAIGLTHKTLQALTDYVTFNGWTALADPPLQQWSRDAGRAVWAMFVADVWPMGVSFHLAFILAITWAGAAIGAAIVPLAASTTLRRVKVRRLLIARAAVYSLTPAVIALGIRCWLSVLQSIGSIFGVNLSFDGLFTWALTRRGGAAAGQAMIVIQMLQGAILIVTFAGFCWILAWWASAMKHGWRISSTGVSLQIGIAQFIIGALTTAVTLLYAQFILR